LPAVSFLAIAFEKRLKNCAGKGIIRPVFGNDLYGQISQICDFTGGRAGQDLIHGQRREICNEFAQEKIARPY
jgi:hypothetical protein